MAGTPPPPVYTSCVGGIETTNRVERTAGGPAEGRSVTTAATTLVATAMPQGSIFEIRRLAVALADARVAVPWDPDVLIHWSSRITSAAVCHRSSGSFAKHLPTT